MRWYAKRQGEPDDVLAEWPGCDLGSRRDTEMVTIIQRGINLAPVQPIMGDEAYRIQRPAFQRGRARVLVRHMHAPSGTGAAMTERKSLFKHLDTEPTGALVLDIGDCG